MEREERQKDRALERGDKSGDGAGVGEARDRAQTRGADSAHLASGTVCVPVQSCFPSAISNSPVREFHTSPSETKCVRHCCACSSPRQSENSAMPVPRSGTP